MTARGLRTDGQQSAAAVAGDASANPFVPVDAAQNGECAGFQQVDLRGIRASMSSDQALAIEEIAED